MLGAIAGDVIGSAYEGSPVKRTDFELFPPGARFTDDTVLTVATAEALLDDGDYAAAYRRLGAARLAVQLAAAGPPWGRLALSVG